MTDMVSEVADNKIEAKITITNVHDLEFDEVSEIETELKLQMWVAKHAISKMFGINKEDIKIEMTIKL